MDENANRDSMDEQEPREPGPDTVRVVSLNLAHGRGRASHQAFVRAEDFGRNLDEVAAFLRSLTPDVVALQEVDFECTWSGRFNHMAYLSERAGLPYRTSSVHVNVRRPPVGPLRYGNAVLSRHPVDLELRHSFPGRLTGRKGFCAATIRLGERKLDVVSVHLDFIRPTTRSRQLASMVELLNVLGDERPLIVAGDFNACSVAEYPLFQVLEEWRGLRKMPFLFAETATFPSARPRHTIDHIWATPDLQFAAYRVHPVRLSDHLPLEAEFRFVV